jgi:hypothetical protein
MAKKYQDIENKPMMAAEPTPIQANSGGIPCGSNHPSESKSTRKRVMASTMSVDDYFDELLSLVHQDYAKL